MKKLALLFFALMAFYSKADINKCIWGAPTNGLHLGVEISPFDNKRDRPPVCTLYVQSAGTNEVNLRIPGAPKRFHRFELHGPDGRLISLQPDKTQLQNFNGVRRTMISSNNQSRSLEVGFFSIPDNFELKTNGQYRLVVSLTVSTNEIWMKNPAYFSLPPTTNVFLISTNDIGK